MEPYSNTENTIWAKRIPRTNMVFMIISLLFVFGLDLFIIISSPSLKPFWYMMLAVMGVFLVFFFLENYLFRKEFTDTRSTLDGWIYAIIFARNIIFLLNFIPFIQLLGLMLLGGFLSLFYSGAGIGTYGAFTLIVPGLLLSYIILIIFRLTTAKKVERGV